LPDGIDNDNEADFESKEDTPTTFTMKPLVAYLNEPYCTVENNGEWVLNEAVDFDYSLYFHDVPDNTSSLHLPIPT